MNGNRVEGAKQHLRRNKATYSGLFLFLAVTGFALAYTFLSGGTTIPQPGPVIKLGLAVFRVGLYVGLLFMYVHLVRKRSPEIPRSVLRKRVRILIFYLVIFEVLVVWNLPALLIQAVS